MSETLQTQPTSEVGPPDIRFENHGTICIIQPLTGRGVEWVNENISYESWQQMGGGIASEPRMAQAVAEGAQEAGLTVEI
jgi:hypothetical protein